MNLTTAVSEIGRYLNDPNNERWTTDAIMVKINEAQKAIQADTRMLKTTETITPVADTSSNSLNARTMDVLRVTITNSNGDKKSIDGTSKEELDYSSPNWENLESGEPATWWFDGRNNLLYLVPKPSSSWAVTNGLSVEEVQYLADITYPTGEFFEGVGATTPYHMAVVHWSVAHCWMEEGTPESLAKGKYHYSGNMDNPGQYELYIKKINKRYDNPTDVPSRIKWKPQGGRLTRTNSLNKSNPMGF